MNELTLPGDALARQRSQALKRAPVRPRECTALPRIAALLLWATRNSR